MIQTVIWSFVVLFYPSRSIICNSYLGPSIWEVNHRMMRYVVFDAISRPWFYRIRVVSPTFPFAPESFRPLSLSPRVVSPPGRFAHFPVRPWVVSPPYKNLFLVLFRPQKCYKALIFLLIDDFALWHIIRDEKKRKKKWAFYTVFWKVTQQSSYVNRNPDLFSVFCVRISHELLWHRKSVFYIVRILSISYFCHFLWTHGLFRF